MVSIIMPTYNRGYIIYKAVESVIAQSYKNWELLIIDDGSSDNTENIVERYCDSRIRYVNLKKNSGACHARNIGISFAHGEYIAFLDSDNVWSNEYLEKRILALSSCNSDIGGVFGYTKLVKQGKEFATVPAEKYEDELRKDLTNDFLIKSMLYENLIDTNTVLIKKKCLDNVNGFDESLKRLQDWEYFFSILLFSGYKLKFINDRLVTNYIGQDSISKDDTKYWDARLIILNKYKDVYKKFNALEDVVCTMYLMLEPYPNVEFLYKMMRMLTQEELKRTMICMRERYEANEKWRTDIANAVESLKEIINRKDAILTLQEKWLILMQHNIDILKGIKSRYKKIAIYGCGSLGKILWKELMRLRLSPFCIIDKYKAETVMHGMPVIHPDKMPNNLDAVIVTVVRDFNKIKEEYGKRMEFISLEQLIDSLYEKIEK